MDIRKIREIGWIRFRVGDTGLGLSSVKRFTHMMGGKAYDVMEIEEEAFAAGADKVIGKPLFESTIQEVLDMVENKQP